jgi:hypothetical protein
MPPDNEPRQTSALSALIMQGAAEGALQVLRMPGGQAAHFFMPQVLFCRLSPEQRELYRAYLASKDVEAILAGDRNALAGIDVLRKICNHPDLLQVLHTAWPPLLAHPRADGNMHGVAAAFRLSHMLPVG